MSLLTEALRLREGRRPTQGERGPSFPPFRGPRPGRWILAVMMLCLLVVLAWWKGPWAVEQVERMAGVAPARPAPNLLASAPREPARVQPSEKKTESGEGEKPAVVAVAAAATAPVVEAASGGGISPEGKQRGELLLKDSLIKTVAEKPAVPAAAPAATADARLPAAATVPAGGLKPMKVELAVSEFIVETPEEKEKKRSEAVEEFLRVLRVQGVRLQGADSRILVDGAPIAVGEKVGALGLVLESVEPQRIIFSDAAGKKYPKSY